MPGEPALPWGDAPVERDGDTVRRRAGPWTPTTQALLGFLAAHGFEGVPRALGVDPRGREVLAYVPGVDGRSIQRYDDRTLELEALLLKDFHDTVAGFSTPAGAVWRTGVWSFPEELAGLPEFAGQRIVCHNDLAPSNVIYLDGRPTTIIDWDLAGPAPVLWDLAYAAWRFVPLYPEHACERMGLPSGPKRGRLERFCSAYGFDNTPALLAALDRRLVAEGSAFAERSRAWLATNAPALLG